MTRTGGALAIMAALLMAGGSAMAQEAKGDWWGVLEAGPTAKLRVAVHILPAQGGADRLIGTFDSLDQNARGLPLSDVVMKGDSLTFKLPVVSGSFEGKWDVAAKGWRGTWSQNGGFLPLLLSAGAPPAAASPSPPAPLPANWAIPDDATIAALIETRIAGRKGEGIVIGVTEPGGHRRVARGPAGGKALDGRTLFEIGSMSKVFTALLLADMTLRGEVALDDPAAKYLPAGASMPERGGHKITLRDLAMHVSGLPRLPDNMPFADMDDPYADYGEAQMLEFLGRYQLPRDIGSQYEYSNFGMGLLGYLLGRAGGTDYETLLKQRITGPLGLTDTVITLSPDQQARFAQGHDAYMRPAKPWRLPVLAGAGGIRSTSDDMLKFLAAAIDPKSVLGPAMTLALAERRNMVDQRVQTGLGWMIVPSTTGGGETIFHGGGTGGFRTSMVIDRGKRRGVVVLTNAAVEPSAEDLAMHLMVGSPVAPAGTVPPAPPPAKAHAEVTLSPAELDRVVGTYELRSNLQLKVWRDGAGLMAQMSGAPVFPLFAEAPLHFFWKVVNAQVRFVAEANGVTGAVLTQDGMTLEGKKLP